MWDFTIGTMLQVTISPTCEENFVPGSTRPDIRSGTRNTSFTLEAITTDESFTPVVAVSIMLSSTTSILVVGTLGSVMGTPAIGTLAVDTATHHTMGSVGKRKVRNMEKQGGGEERKVPEGGGHAVDVKNFHNV